MRSLIALAALAAIISPASAGTMACMAGEANETLETWMKATHQRPVMKLMIDTGGEPWPAMLLGKSDGTFSIVVLMNGMACMMAVGHGMAPAAADLKFPLAGKPS